MEFRVFCEEERLLLGSSPFLISDVNTYLLREASEKKEYDGKTPTDYRMELKLDAAKRMIDSENASFTYISEVLGFDSPAYFSRFFKKQTGLSPRKYRERLSHNNHK